MFNNKPAPNCGIPHFGAHQSYAWTEYIQIWDGVKNPFLNTYMGFYGIFERKFNLHFWIVKPFTMLNLSSCVKTHFG